MLPLLLALTVTTTWQYWVALQVALPHATGAPLALLSVDEQAATKATVREAAANKEESFMSGLVAQARGAVELAARALSDA